MKTLTSSLSAEDTVSRLLTGIETAKLRVVAHINGQANAARIGAQVPADQVIEVFRPDFAMRVWDACKAAGHDIPLRIHVYEERGGVKVACRMPSEVFAPFGVDKLDVIGRELDELFAQILNCVPEA